MSSIAIPSFIPSLITRSVRPDEVTVIRNNAPLVADPSIVELDEIIRVKPGEKVALDGELVSENASFNMAALTG